MKWRYRHAELSPENRAALRQGLLAWLKDYLPAHPQEDTCMARAGCGSCSVAWKGERGKPGVEWICAKKNADALAHSGEKQVCADAGGPFQVGVS